MEVPHGQGAVAIHRVPVPPGLQYPREVVGRSIWAKRATAGQAVAPHLGQTDACGALAGLAVPPVSEWVSILSAEEWTCLTQTWPEFELPVALQVVDQFEWVRR